MNNFPRVTIPGLEVSDESRAVLGEINAQHEAWRGLKMNAAMALMRTGQQPYVKPPAHVMAKRRAAAKAARKARRASH